MAQRSDGLKQVCLLTAAPALQPVTATPPSSRYRQTHTHTMTLNDTHTHSSWYDRDTGHDGLISQIYHQDHMIVLHLPVHATAQTHTHTHSDKPTITQYVTICATLYTLS